MDELSRELKELEELKNLVNQIENINSGSDFDDVFSFTDFRIKTKFDFGNSFETISSLIMRLISERFINIPFLLITIINIKTNENNQFFTGVLELCTEFVIYPAYDKFVFTI
jgi:hypothetical protein